MPDELYFARRELTAGRYHYAVQFSQYALARDPEDAESLQVFGLASLRCGDIEAGIDALERAALMAPLSNTARIDLAIAYGGLGRTSLSRDLLMAVATSEKRDEADLLRIATGLEAIDEPRLAMEACRQANKLAPDCAAVPYRMGSLAQQCGHPVSTTEALVRHAIALEPDNLHYRIGLASLLIRLDRKPEALQVIDRVIPEQLEQVTCQCCLKRIANLFFDCGDEQRARLCAQRLEQIRRRESATVDGLEPHEAAG